MKTIIFLTLLIAGCSYGPEDKFLQPGQAKRLDEAKLECEKECAPREVHSYRMSDILGNACYCKMTPTNSDEGKGE